jgi:hypothetical protein
MSSVSISCGCVSVYHLLSMNDEVHAWKCIIHHIILANTVMIHLFVVFPYFPQIREIDQTIDGNPYDSSQSRLRYIIKLSGKQRQRHEHDAYRDELRKQCKQCKRVCWPCVRSVVHERRVSGVRWMDRRRYVRHECEGC